MMCRLLGVSAGGYYACQGRRAARTQGDVRRACAQHTRPTGLVPAFVREFHLNYNSVRMAYPEKKQTTAPNCS